MTERQKDITAAMIGFGIVVVIACAPIVCLGILWLNGEFWGF